MIRAIATLLIAAVSAAALAQAPANPPVRIRSTVDRIDGQIVVAFTPADRSELKPGAAVFVNAQRQADGRLTAPRVNVGLKGQIPPM